MARRRDSVELVDCAWAESANPMPKSTTDLMTYFARSPVIWRLENLAVIALFIGSAGDDFDVDLFTEPQQLSPRMDRVLSVAARRTRTAKS